MSASSTRCSPRHGSLRRPGPRFGPAILLASLLATGLLSVGGLVPALAGRAVANEPVSEKDDSPALPPAEAAKLIRSLGDNRFAERERAMGEILHLGSEMVPYLQEAVKNEEDAELVFRARVALNQLIAEDLEARIQAFLSGGPGLQDSEWFEGWPEVEQVLGDSQPARQLFVEVMKAHPEVPPSLDGTTDERAAVAERVAISIQTGKTERSQFPTQADAVALLLPLTDPEVRLSGGYEATLIWVFNTQVGRLRQDAHLWPGISSLLEQWLLRSSPQNRVDVLWSSMQWDLEAGRELAKQTIAETTDIEALQNSLLVIARFGTAEDAPALAKLLDDSRPTATTIPAMVGNRPIKSTVADLALAAIAVLHDVPLEELGMSAPATHPRVGFMVEQIGYTEEDADKRPEAIEKARRWIEGEPPERPRS